MEIQPASIPEPSCGAPARTWYLLPCVKSRSTHPCLAKDMFVSQWFRLARTLAESQGSWLLLSAQHGLVAPDQPLQPGHETMSDKSYKARRAWAERILPELLQLTSTGDTLVMLGSERYRENLLLPLQEAGRHVITPLQGLDHGQQLDWLIRRLEELGVQPPGPRERTAEEKQQRRDRRAARRSP